MALPRRYDGDSLRRRSPSPPALRATGRRRRHRHGRREEWILHAVGVEDCVLGRIREALGEILGGMKALGTGPAAGCA